MVRTVVNDVMKELPAIQDTARKVTTVLDSFTGIAGDIKSIRNVLPTLDIKVTEVHDELPAISGKVTAIHDELLPAIRDAMQHHLTVHSSFTKKQ